MKSSGVLFYQREFCPESGAMTSFFEDTVCAMNRKNLAARWPMKAHHRSGHFYPKLDKSPDGSPLAFSTILQKPRFGSPKSELLQNWSIPFSIFQHPPTSRTVNFSTIRQTSTRKPESKVAPNREQAALDLQP